MINFEICLVSKLLMAHLLALLLLVIEVFLPLNFFFYFK